MVKPGDIVDHAEMSRIEGRVLQKGMNFRPRGRTSVFLMSRRPDAPYEDQTDEGGRTLVYVGHDVRPEAGGPEPKTVDQPLSTPEGRPSDNAKFLGALEASRAGAAPERVRVWEKIKTNIWAFNGVFELQDAWQEHDGTRSLFKFKLRLVDEEAAPLPLVRSRVIPSSVKAAVWKRDHGTCVLCGETSNLHFDHELPYSKGGSSLIEANVRILCARHNLAKGARIE